MEERKPYKLTNTILNRINDSLHPELKEMFYSKEDLPAQYKQKLFEVLNDDNSSYKELFDFGISQLPNERKHEPDYGLSNYFLVLSELKGVSKETRDLAMDAVVYSEVEDAQLTTVKDGASLKEAYKEIAPFLE